MKKEKSTHDKLCNAAIRWLYSRGCSIYAQEVPTWNGIADAVGMITNQRQYGGDETIYYIEAKASRTDLICSKQQKCHANTESLFEDWNKDHKNDIDFFYFIVAAGVEVEKKLFPMWGVINCNGKVIRKAKRMPKNKDSVDLIINIAHALVYQAFGKLYLP